MQNEVIEKNDLSPAWILNQRHFPKFVCDKVIEAIFSTFDYFYVLYLSSDFQVKAAIHLNHRHGCRADSSITSFNYFPLKVGSVFC